MAAEARTNPAPPVIPVDPDGIDDDLKGLPQWVVWRIEVRNAKPTKPPLRADGPGYARTDDRTTWATFGAAYATYRTRDLAGVGFVLTPEDPFFMVDLDKCRDAETGEIDQWALPIVGRFRHAHVEVSPTGTGVKIIGRGRLAGALHVKAMVGRPGAKVEIYDATRYTTLTGVRL
jgi:primase-polymerase (primpol)-like protein